MAVAVAARGGSTAAIACRCLTSPLPLAGLAVLLVNDHLLKQAMPGALTGKLSDLGGLACFPFLLAAALGLVVRRPRLAARLAFGATAVTFAIVKVAEDAAAEASAALSAVFGPSLIRADATDLVALAVLYPAWLLWLRYESASTAPSPRPVVAYAVLPLAVLATVATSCTQPNVVHRLQVDDGVLHAGPFASSDGGRTWSDAEKPESTTGDYEERPVVSCHPEDDQVCYRVDGQPQVEASTDGGQTWTVAWQIPADRRRFVQREDERSTGCGTGGLIGAVDGEWVEADGEWSFVAALQNEGVVVGGADGSWRQVAVGQAAPERWSASFASITPEYIGTGVAALAALWTGLAIAGVRLHDRHPTFDTERPWAGLRVMLTIIVAVVLGFATVLVGFFSDAAVMEAIILALIVAGSGTTWSAWMSRTRTGLGDRRAPRRALASAAVCWVVAVAPFVGWSAGVLPYRAALATTVVATLLLAPWVVRRAQDRAAPVAGAAALGAGPVGSGG